MRKLYALLFALFVVSITQAQTTLISPTGDGGFETGTDFAANGWTVVNGANTTRAWYVGSPASFGYTGTRCAFIGNDNATVSTTTSSRTVHFYRSITLPANAVNITLSFKYKQTTPDNTYDYLKVFLNSNVPVSGSAQTTGTIVTVDPSSTTPYSSFTTVTATIPTSFAGTTNNLIFSFKSDAVTPHGQGAVDDISLTYNTGTPCTTPADQPTGLTVGTNTSTTIAGSFTAAGSAPSGYLVVRSSGAFSGTPVDGTTYSAGNTIGNGTVIQASSATSFSASSLSGNTAYTITAFAYNSGTCSGGPKYNSASPLTAVLTTCPAVPSVQTYSNLTTTGFRLGFTSAKGGGALAVNYTLDVATDAAFTNIVSTLTPSDTTTTQSTMYSDVTGLTAGTTYFIRAKATNGACASAYSSVVYINTLCTSAANIPYTEGFDNGTIPPCTLVQDVNNDATTWGVVTAPTGYTGYVLRYSYNSSNAANDWFYTKGVNLVGGASYRISYKYGNNSTSYTEKLKVAYGTAQDAAAMTTTLATYASINNNTPTLGTVDFTVPSSGVYYFGFQAYSAANQYILYVDSISVTPGPTCVAPTNVTAGTLTSNSATISWAGSGNYILEYGPAGFTPGSGTTAGANGTLINPATNPQNITGLTSSTSYDVYVRQDCSGAGNGYSVNSAKVAFTTTCVPVSLFSENFDGVTTPNLPNCWSKILRGTTLSSFATLTTSSTSHTSPNGVQIYNSSSGASDDIILVSPVINNLSSGTRQVRFWAKNSTTGMNLQVGTLDNNTSSAVFTSLQTVTLTTTFTEYTVSLAGYSGTDTYIGFRSTNGSTYNYIYIDDVVYEAIPTCLVPTALTVTPAQTTAAIGWTASTSNPAGGYQWEVRTSGVAGSGATGLVASGSVAAGVTSDNATGLTAGTAYTLYVRSNCGSGDYSSWASATFNTLIVNDDATGALTLTVGAGCTGNPYTNAGATQATGEPFASCKGTAGYNTVWFKFVAPASGSVKISNDYSGGTMGSDSRLSLYSATDASNYATFSSLACDDDNGTTVSSRSIIYATGLTAGNTYYVQVDGYSNSTSTGTFCVTVDELSNSMLSSTAGSCTSAQDLSSISAGYTGWLSVVDNSGNLVAMVKDPAGASGTYSSAVTITTGTPRQSGGISYLNRNYRITKSGATNVNVRFFFLNSELTALNAVNGATLSTISVTRQTETTANCYANFSAANGTSSRLLQTGNGSANGVSWIDITTPGFSNFYIQAATGTVLPANLLTFSGSRQGNANQLKWSVAQERDVQAYQVERSEDGTKWSTVGSVASLGNTSAQRGYGFTDNNVTGLKQLYRLRQVDVNGSAKLSNVISISGAKPLVLALSGLFPNPASSKLNVMIDAPAKDNITVTVTDAVGRVVKTQKAAVEAGSNTVQVDVAGFAQGSYLVKVSCDNNCQSATGKFVKE